MEPVGQDTLPSEASLPMIDGLGEIPADHPAAALLEPLIDGAPTVDALLAQLRWHQVAPAARVPRRRSSPTGAGPAPPPGARRSSGIGEGGNDIARARRAHRSPRCCRLPIGWRCPARPGTAMGPRCRRARALGRADEGVSARTRGRRLSGRQRPPRRIGRVTPGVRRFGAIDAHERSGARWSCVLAFTRSDPRADAAVERATRLGSGLPRLADRDVWPCAAASRLPRHGASRSGACSSCWRSSSGCRRSPGTRRRRGLPPLRGARAKAGRPGDA